MKIGDVIKCKSREDMTEKIRKVYSSGFRYYPNTKELKVEVTGKAGACYIIDQACEDICMNYCKYPDIWDEDEKGPLADSEVCASCPLNALRY